ncbi:MAG: 30S ribosomal protein THX [Bacteroidota bacterium]|jgi:30S ribosomal protein S31
MGRGDKKTAKGKRAIGSYGNSRPKKQSKPMVAAAPKAKAKAEPAEKKPAAKKATPKAATEKKTTAKKTTKKVEE